jgi:hypothetical protein
MTATNYYDYYDYDFAKIYDNDLSIPTVKTSIITFNTTTMTAATSILDICIYQYSFNLQGDYRYKDLNISSTVTTLKTTTTTILRLRQRLLW